MNNWKTISVFSILLIILIYGCKIDPKKEYEKVVREWTGRTLQFPESIQTVSGEPVMFPESDFTILAYYDSVGCTSCKMRLPYWEEFMAKVNTVVGYGRVSLMIITNQSPKETRYLIRKNSFYYPVYIDTMDSLVKLNPFPSNPDLQSFLLDKERKVLAIGNPTASSAIQNLFLNKMKDNSETFSFDSVYEKELEHSFDKINKNQEVKKTFSLWNDTNDTLRVSKILTSCECTKGTISNTVIPPGDTYSVTAIFKDSVLGEFLRSVTVTFENHKPDIRIELTGEIINNQ